MQYENTDRELYREPADMGMGYYANSVFVTKEGSIGMNVGGYVIVCPIAQWHTYATQAQNIEKERQDMKDALADLIMKINRHDFPPNSDLIAELESKDE